MGVYKLTQKDIYFGTRNVTFCTVPTAYKGRNVWVLSYVVVGDVGEAVSRLDEAWGSDEWQHCVGMFYNPNMVNQATVLAVMHQLYPAIKPLDHQFTQDTTLYSNVQLNQNSVAYSGSVSPAWQGRVGEQETHNLSSSIIEGYINLRQDSVTDYAVNIYIPCVFEDQVSEDGFNLVQNDYYPMVQIRYQYTRFGEKIVELHILGDYRRISSGDISAFSGIKPKPFNPDPYDDDDDGNSDEGGGSGSDDQDNWGDDSDDNPVPPLPGLSAVDTGFITLFNPTLAQLKNLAHYMWSNLFDITAFKRLYADPMDVILGLAIVPVDVAHGTLSTVCIGNVSTGVQMYKALSQYVELNCGKVKVGEKWHSYLDYGPYTNIHIMLPYIGARELDVNEIMGREVGVKYHVDILNGACVAFVTVTTSDNKEHVIAQFSGQCSISIPVSSKDYTNTIIALTNLVATGAVLATGGMAAPTEAAAVAGAASETANITANVINSKPKVAISGNLGGGSGLLGVQKPFLIFERPKLCRPDNQKNYTGYPSYITLKLGDLKGFTQIRDIHLDNFSMTEEEHDILLETLREGVML